MSLERDVGEIKGRLDYAIELLEDQKKEVNAVKKRVSSLERWQSSIVGAATVAGAAIGLFAEDLLNAIKKII